MPPTFHLRVQLNILCVSMNVNLALRLAIMLSKMTGIDHYWNNFIT